MPPLRSIRVTNVEIRNESATEAGNATPRILLRASRDPTIQRPVSSAGSSLKSKSSEGFHGCNAHRPAIPCDRGRHRLAAVLPPWLHSLDLPFARTRVAVHVPHLDPFETVSSRTTSSSPVPHRESAIGCRQAVHPVGLVPVRSHAVVSQGIHISIHSNQGCRAHVQPIIVDPQLRSVDSTAVSSSVQPINAHAKTCLPAMRTVRVAGEIGCGRELPLTQPPRRKHPQPRQFRRHRIGNIEPPKSGLIGRCVAVSRTRRKVRPALPPEFPDHPTSPCRKGRRHASSRSKRWRYLPIPRPLFNVRCESLQVYTV